MLVLGVLGLGGLWQTADGGVPLWWHLRGSDVERVVLRWSGQRLELTDPAEIARFSQALRAAPYDLPYETRCIPDKSPEKWSITLVRRNQPDFKVFVGVDGCCSLYSPELKATYTCQTVAPLLKQKLGLRSFTVAEAFQ
jgi:hypothetical protein